MPGRAFFDTNILIYAFSSGDWRQEPALKLLETGGTIGVQTLNEFLHVSTVKLKTPWQEALRRLELIESLCGAPTPVTMGVHRRGVRLAASGGFGLYDAMMLSAAIESSCGTFYSEDLNHSQKVEGLTIHNPFRRVSPHG